MGRTTLIALAAAALAGVAAAYLLFGEGRYEPALPQLSLEQPAPERSGSPSDTAAADPDTESGARGAEEGDAPTASGGGSDDRTLGAGTGGASGAPAADAPAAGDAPDAQRDADPAAEPAADLAADGSATPDPATASETSQTARTDAEPADAIAPADDESRLPPITVPRLPPDPRDSRPEALRREPPPETLRADPFPDRRPARDHLAERPQPERANDEPPAPQADTADRPTPEPEPASPPTAEPRAPLAEGGASSAQPQTAESQPAESQPAESQPAERAGTRAPNLDTAPEPPSARTATTSPDSSDDPSEAPTPRPRSPFAEAGTPDADPQPGTRAAAEPDPNGATDPADNAGAERDEAAAAAPDRDTTTAPSPTPRAPVAEGGTPPADSQPGARDAADRTAGPEPGPEPEPAPRAPVAQSGTPPADAQADAPTRAEPEATAPRTPAAAERARAEPFGDDGARPAPSPRAPLAEGGTPGVVPPPDPLDQRTADVAPAAPAPLAPPPAPTPAPDGSAAEAGPIGEGAANGGADRAAVAPPPPPPDPDPQTGDAAPDDAAVGRTSPESAPADRSAAGRPAPAQGPRTPVGGTLPANGDAAGDGQVAQAPPAPTGAPARTPAVDGAADPARAATSRTAPDPDGSAERRAPASASQTARRPADAAAQADADAKDGTSRPVQVIERDGDDPAAPSFDVVRVERSGDAVIAGRAEPGARVTVLDNDRAIATAEADRSGSFVAIPDRPLSPGQRQLTLRAEQQAGPTKESRQAVVIDVPRTPIRGAGGRSSAGDGDSNAGNDGGADLPGRQPLAVLVPRAGRTGEVEILQRPDGGAGIEDQALVLESVQYTVDGRIVVSGEAPAKAQLALYLNANPLTDTRADSSGDWSAVPDAPIPPGLHTLRVDQLGPEGRVQARVETPFSSQPMVETLDREGLVVVQPGNNLWTIARRTYGEGWEYTVIYEANQDQIRDPDLIYPGQVFVLPDEDATR